MSKEEEPLRSAAAEHGIGRRRVLVSPSTGPRKRYAASLVAPTTTSSIPSVSASPAASEDPNSSSADDERAASSPATTVPTRGPNDTKT